MRSRRWKMWPALVAGFIACAVPLSAGHASFPRQSANDKLLIVERSERAIRHLSELRPVKAVFLADKQFNAAFADASHRGSPDSEIDLSQREWFLLGMLKKSDDLRKILFNGLASQVGGFYDDQRKILYVRNHDNQVLGVRRDLIAHEYTHALQDQHYNLRKLAPDAFKVGYRNTDISTAHRGVIEGDAVTTQFLFVYRTYSPTELREWVTIQTQPNKSPTLPRAVQRSFSWPYTAGFTFVQKVFRLGGMSAVDALYRRLPRSTYEIMYPNAYLNHWKPVQIALHAVQGFSDWKQTDDDVMGAFGYDLYFWQYLTQSEAQRATAGYRGDRYIFLQNGSQSAMRLESVWNTSGDALLARRTIVKGLRHHFPGKVTGAGSLLATPDGGVFVRVRGKHLTLALAPSSDLAAKLGAAQTS